MLPLLLPIALATTTIGVVEQWCPSESVATAAACPGGCAQVIRNVRAIERDGTRHLMWSNAGAPHTLYTARQLDEATWEYNSFPGPAGFDTSRLDVDGDLLAVAWGSQVDLFRLVDGAWVTEATLTSGALNFGASVAVSSPPGGPERVVVGAASTAIGGPPGSTIVFHKDATWALEQTIPAPAGLATAPRFGFGVAIDGDQIAIAAPGSESNYDGPISIFDRIDGTWVLASSIPVPTWLEGALGERMALRGDTLAALNAAGFVSTSLHSSRVQVFQRNGATWTPTELLQAEAAGTIFGRDLSMRVDGDDLQLVVAASKNSTNALVFTGAWMYRLHQGIVIDKTRLRNPKGDLDGPDVQTPATFVVVGARGPWAALAAPGATGVTSGSAIRVVELSACPITPDLNGDGIVNGADLGLLLGNWGGTGLGDLNDDGVVDGGDLGTLLAAWT